MKMARSRLGSIGHKVSKHPFNVVEIASTRINETATRATNCATGSLDFGPHTPLCHGVPLLLAGLRVSVATAVAATSPV
ncbi:hypothetical protein PENNAL_c0838G10278, partial [Penicillium nalgiovense]